MGPRRVLGTVTEAWRYPIKSLGGSAVGSLELNSRGVLGDRAFAVYGADGKIGSGKATRRFRRMPGLLECTAQVDEAGAITLRTPGGEACAAPSTEADAALTDFLGEPVQLQPERSIPHFDVAPLHLLSTSTLKWLEQRLGAPVPSTRFRPNLVLHTPAAPPSIEASWVGRRLRVGSAVLEVTAPTERCVMVNLQQPGLPTDERVLRLIALERDALLGVCASVVVPGTICLGDDVALLD